MRTEIIAIGDELVSGQRVDTNSAWLSRALAEVGISVGWHTTVGDQLEDLVHVLQQAGARADLAILTGGLGPTADDLTREALAGLAGLPLVLDEAMLAAIESLFRRRQRAMPERNRVQAMFPESSRPIPNRHGTAPGIDLTWKSPAGRSCRFFALPGVPAEMQEMWEQTVLPAVLELQGVERQVILQRRLKCFGAGESEIEARLPDLIRRGRQPLVGITASQATITLRISSRAATREACLSQIVPTETTIRELLGELVFGEEDDELQDVVVRQLRELNRSVAVIDQATCGWVSRWLAEADPMGDVFRGGWVAGPLWRPLSLHASGGAGGPTAIEAREPVPPSATAAAEWLRQVAGVDYGLAIGGPDRSRDPDGDAAPVTIALAEPRRTLSFDQRLGGHPEIRLPRLAKQALDVIRRHLRRAPRGSVD